MMSKSKSIDKYKNIYEIVVILVILSLLYFILTPLQNEFYVIIILAPFAIGIHSIYRLITKRK